jgi:hypothetical protein
MKHFLHVLGLIAGFFAYGVTEANAVVCARGVVRAGCVGPYGAVGVRRPVVAPRVVVSPRRVVVAPTRVVVRRRWR